MEGTSPFGPMPIGEILLLVMGAFYTVNDIGRPSNNLFSVFFKSSKSYILGFKFIKIFIGGGFAQHPLATISPLCETLISMVSPASANHSKTRNQNMWLVTLNLKINGA